MNLRAVASALGGEVCGGQVIAPGPGHSPKDRSLAVRPSPDAPDGFVVHSHAGDDPLKCKDYVRAKIGAEPFKGNGSKAGATHSKTVDKIYDYHDENYEILFQVVRFKPKDFRQRRPDGSGGWVWSLGETRRVLYHLPELLEAIANEQPIFVVEGEKDADALIELGVVATCNSGGAEKWRDEHSATLAGADVIIIPDKDEAGEKHLEKTARSLLGVGAKVRVLHLPAKDAFDWIADGGTAEQLWQLVDGIEVADPTPSEKGLIVSAHDFITGFVPPDYLIDRVLRRRFANTLTGRTGDGKTAVMMRIGAQVVHGQPIGKYNVERGRVLYLAGENPDDIRMRWMAMAYEMKFDPGVEGMHFIEGRFSISELFSRVSDEVSKLGGVDFVEVDTSATYFEKDDENDNVQMGNHARMLRTLTTLPGSPAVLVACHPTKHATNESMLPRGGGAFLAEVDGNLTCIKTGTIAEVHWQGKFRGCDFAPISFQLHTATAPSLVDSKMRPIPTVMANPITEELKAEIEGVDLSDQDQVLLLMQMHPGKSLADMASSLSWFYESGDPDKSRSQRATNALKKDGMVKLERNKWTLTEKGKKEAKRLEP
jgi:hypothetical protein